MSLIQVETMANITRHCKLNKILNITEHHNIGTVAAAQRRACTKIISQFQDPQFPSRPASLFRIGHLVERQLSGRQGYGLSPLHFPAIFNFNHARSYEKFSISLIIIQTVMAYPIRWIINTELLDSVFLSWRIMQIKEQAKTLRG